MQQSILALIKNRWGRQRQGWHLVMVLSRDQRLAERGINNMEEHTAEIRRKDLQSDLDILIYLLLQAEPGVPSKYEEKGRRGEWEE